MVDDTFCFFFNTNEWLNQAMQLRCDVSAGFAPRVLIIETALKTTQNATKRGSFHLVVNFYNLQV